MKTNEKLRGCEFYKTLATEIQQLGGIVTQDKMKDLIDGVSVELGYNKPVVTKNIEDKFLDIYHDIVEVAVVERSKEERGVGKNKTQRLISYVKGLSDETIENTVTEYFKAGNRVKPAIAAKEEEPKSKKKKHWTVKKDDIVYLFLLLKKAESIRDIDPESIKKLLKKKTISQEWTENWLKRFKDVGITICYTIVKEKRSWRLSFSESTVPVYLEKVAGYAKKNYGIQFAEFPPNEKGKEVKKAIFEAKAKSKSGTAGDVEYILFVMAALGFKRRGPIDFALIGRYLRENRWRKINTSNYELESIVKSFPEILVKGHNNTYSVNNDEKVWKEVQKFNPKNQRRVIPCVINSGLTLEDVKAWFSESTQERPDIEMPCRVINIVMSKSIKDFLKLAGLKKKMRECDFFIGEEDLARRLDIEAAYMEKIVESELLGCKVLGDSHEANKVLIQLEEL